MQKIRTDLAVEANEIWKESAGEQTKLSGVKAEDVEKNGYKITTVKILDEEGAKQLGKPVGTYVTIELDRYMNKEENAFEDGVKTIGEKTLELLNLKNDESVLVVGLGNGAITPDAIGPQTARSTMVTRHLVEQMPEQFGNMRKVSVLESGVLGTTGIESSEFIKAVVEKLKPEKVIVIDALASRKLSRVCRTVQLADTGIVPGSGVGNKRAAINQSTLGVPVIAIGVPTVVDAGTLAADIMEQAGSKDVNPQEMEKYGGSMIVTPKEIDSDVKDITKLIGYGINNALHNNMDIDEITMYLS